MAAQLVCTQCGHVGTPKSAVKGSFGVEVVLWLLFIFPGIIYSVWRMTSRHKACRSCGATNLVPLDSPIGRKMSQP